MDDHELRQLQEDAFQLKELADHPGWGTLTRLVEAWVDVQQHTLTSGGANTMEEYQKLVGRIHAARLVIRLPGDIVRRAREASSGK